MPAYLIANITVTDPVRYEEYRRQVPALIARHGGKYLVRGGAIETLEGALGLDRLVILEFASMAAARAFHDGEDYAPLLRLREQSTRSQVVLVDGFAG